MTEETEEAEAEAASTHADGDVVTDAAGDAQAGSREDLDSAAESFLTLEDDLDAGEVSGTAWGHAVDVERVPAGSVPDTYPVEIRSEEALALALDVDGDRVRAYFGWDDAPEDRLGRLLELKNIPADRFADLHGESLFLAVEDGHYVPVVPEESPRGSPLGVYGVGAGFGLNLLVALLGLLGLGSVVASAPVVAVWLLANLVGLPAATYADAWHHRTHTDWNGGPLFWTTLAAIPGVNVLSSAAYLLGRARSTPLG